ncbi:MAG: hypothetical protein IID33_14925 [Planctomycetes bacterium]|nr:hypothetical protein [Planctomycetota bacterium]
MIAFDTPWTEADTRITQSVRLGEITVSLRSDLDEVAADFSGLYRGSPPGEQAEAGTIRMDVRRVRGSSPPGRRYGVFGDGRQMGKPLRRDEVLPQLEWAINSRVILTRTDFLQLRAAGMVRDGVGVILAGGSGSGKSTLAAALLVRGWRYGSDDLILIDPATGFMHPFPKAICVRSGAFDIIERLALPMTGGRYHVKGVRGRVGYINPHDVAPDRVAKPGPVRFVVFPNYVRGTPSNLFAMPPGRAVYGLVSVTLNRAAFTDHGVSILSAFSAGAECLGLDAGEIEESCDLLDAMVDGSG